MNADAPKVRFGSKADIRAHSMRTGRGASKTRSLTSARRFLRRPTHEIVWNTEHRNLLGRFEVEPAIESDVLQAIRLQPRSSGDASNWAQKCSINRWPTRLTLHCRVNADGAEVGSGVQPGHALTRRKARLQLAMPKRYRNRQSSLEPSVALPVLKSGRQGIRPMKDTNNLGIENRSALGTLHGAQSDAKKSFVL